MSNLIERQAAIDVIEAGRLTKLIDAETAVNGLKALPSAQPEIIRCKDCKYFELDHFEKTRKFPVPIVVAHEICMKWGNGCKSSVDGWCFMAERRTDSDGRV